MKRIHIVGVGYNPNTTNSTNYTYLNGNNYPNSSIYLSPGASGGSLIGVLIPVSLYVGNPDGCVTNYKIWRCKISTVASQIDYNWGCSPSNLTIIECIISSIVFPSASNLCIYNNILDGISGIGSGNIVRNNIFLAASYPLNAYSAIYSSNFENNIFLGSPFVIYYSNTFYNNVFNNNIFVENVTFPYPGTTNIGFNNIVNQSQGSIFVNQNGNTFGYDQDYHLQSSCPGKHAGHDGTDIGIYGGLFPWKDGSIPFNPHFDTITITPTTDQSGNLPVNIKVSAQDR